MTHAGELGRVFAGEFVFHNAYGPDKPWYRDPRLVGGGVADLGVHLVDLALWSLGFPGIVAIESRPTPGAGAGFDPAAADYATAARVVDPIYGRVTSR